MRQSYVIFHIDLYKAQILKIFCSSFPLLKPVLNRIALILLLFFFVSSTEVVRFFKALGIHIETANNFFSGHPREKLLLLLTGAKKQEVLFFGFRRSMCLIFRALYLQHFLMLITWTDLG